MNDWLRIAFVNVYPFFAYCIFVYVAFKKKKNDISFVFEYATYDSYLYI